MAIDSTKYADFREYRLWGWKLSQRDLARKCGKHQAQVALLESGKLPGKPWHYENWLKFLEISLEEFQRLVIACRDDGLVRERQHTVQMIREYKEVYGETFS